MTCRVGLNVCDNSKLYNYLYYTMLGVYNVYDILKGLKVQYMYVYKKTPHIVQKVIIK